MRAARGSGERPVVACVEDDQEQRALLAEYLERSGYHVEVASTGAAAVALLADLQPDAMLVDLGLPDADGVELCQRFSTWPACPIVVISADHREDRIVAALDAGASDYVTKPYSTTVLAARLRAAMRDRDPAQRTLVAEVVELGDLVLDIGAHQVFVEGQLVDLPARPFAVLELLARNEGGLVPFAALVGRRRGEAPTSEDLRALRIAVSRIRKALGSGPHRPIIVTEQRVGYRLLAPDQPAR